MEERFSVRKIRSRRRFVVHLGVIRRGTFASLEVNTHGHGSTHHVRCKI